MMDSGDRVVGECCFAEDLNEGRQEGRLIEGLEGFN